MHSLPILFLPGTLCTGAMFTHQINQLKKHCNNISVVQFKQASTLKEMANLVIKAANNKPCALVGFSMGGIVAEEVAKTHPHLIAKLALVNSNCHADLPERKAGRAALIKEANDSRLAILIQNTFMPNYLYKQDKKHQKIIIDMALTLGEKCFEAQVTAIEDRPDSLHILQKLDADKLIIGGLQDKICNAEHQRYMHKSLPNSQLVLLDECAHFSPLEQAEKVSNALTKWYLYPISNKNNH